MNSIFSAQPHLQHVYDRHLCNLVSIKSEYSSPAGIEECIEYCRTTVSRGLPRFRIHRDVKGNLLAFSDRFDASRNAVFLSAHVDTVDADATEWTSSCDPFRAVDTTSHIIGRGANDCKAGVAMMLLLTHMVEGPTIDNIVLLFSNREEGNQEKTSTKIGEELGYSIPLSNRSNLVICLENTVDLAKGSQVLGVYDCEPCNAFISIKGDLGHIRAFLRDKPCWKPIAIRPTSLHQVDAWDQELAGTSGHGATTQNDVNLILRAIMDQTSGIVIGGDEQQTSVLRNNVRIKRTTDSVNHVAVLNCRELTSVDDLQTSLAGVDYREHYPFAYAAGSDRRVALEYGLAKKLITTYQRKTMPIEFCANPGRSDASAIWNAASERERLEIVTMGPGTRSHVDEGIFRKTHGPDEGFHKASGYLAVDVIFELIGRYLVGPC